MPHQLNIGKVFFPTIFGFIIAFVVGGVLFNFDFVLSILSGLVGVFILLFTYYFVTTYLKIGSKEDIHG